MADLERTLAPFEVSAALKKETATIDLVLEPMDNERLANLCGQFDQNLKQIETGLRITIANRGNAFHLNGSQPNVENAARVVNELFELAADGTVGAEDVHIALHLPTTIPTIGLISRIRENFCTF